MKNEDRQIRLYQTSLKIAVNEGNIFWQSSHVFLISNTIIGSVIINFISSKFDTEIANRTSNMGIFILSILGLIVSLIWWVSYQRRASYYRFRMAQVRKNEPKEWDLIGGNGRLFSEGAEVKINGEKYRLPRPARFFNTEEIHFFLIIVFVFAFSISAYFSWPFH